jgi:hypothetical protein
MEWSVWPISDYMCFLPRVIFTINKLRVCAMEIQLLWYDMIWLASYITSIEFSVLSDLIYLIHPYRCLKCMLICVLKSFRRPNTNNPLQYSSIQIIFTCKQWQRLWEILSAYQMWTVGIIICWLASKLTIRNQLSTRVFSSTAIIHLRHKHANTDWAPIRFW